MLKLKKLDYKKPYSNSPTLWIVPECHYVAVASVPCGGNAFDYHHVKIYDITKEDYPEIRDLGACTLKEIRTGLYLNIIKSVNSQIKEKSRNKIGRPKKDPSKRKSERVSIRLKPEDKNRIIDQYGSVQKFIDVMMIIELQ